MPQFVGVRGAGFFVEKHHFYQSGNVVARSFQEFAYRIQGYFRRLGYGIAVDSGRYTSESDAIEIIVSGKGKGGTVARGQQIRFAVSAAPPNGSDGVQYFFRGQFSGIGHDGLAGGASSRSCRTLP